MDRLKNLERGCVVSTSRSIRVVHALRRSFARDSRHGVAHT